MYETKGHSYLIRNMLKVYKYYNKLLLYTNVTKVLKSSYG